MSATDWNANALVGWAAQQVTTHDGRQTPLTEKEGTNWHTIQIKWLKRLGDLSLGIDGISSDVQQNVWYDLIRS